MRRGFTLVEMVVAMGVFMILLSIASGTFVNAMRSQRAAIALIAANSNASLAMEQMAREIRTGGGFSAAGGELRFINSKGEDVAYRLNTETQRIERGAGGSDFYEITADNVSVRKLNFILFEGSPSDPYPPRITVVLQVGAAAVPFVESAINLETTISVRVLN